MPERRLAVRKTTKKEFETFKREFRRWQKRLGLTDWKVYFSHEPLEEAYAQVTSSMLGATATVTLTTEVEDHAADGFDAAASARHEALELLVAPLEALAISRHVASGSVEIEKHRVVRRLENLLEEV